MVEDATKYLRKGPLKKSARTGRVAHYRQNGLQFLVLENHEIRTIVLPAVGGKMVELTNKQSGTQFLRQPVRAYSKTHLPYYGAAYPQEDPSGCDDCFPTIAASTITTKEQGQPRALHFPDHGELWGIPWVYHVSKDTPALYLHTEGVRWQYEFSKTMWLEHATVHIAYRMINESAVPFEYLWSLQPWLQAPPGSEIGFEPGVDRVMLDWTTDASLGQPGEYLPWPLGQPGRESNSAVLPIRPENHTLKVYTDALVDGCCEYTRSDTGESIRFEFDPQHVPYVGVLLGYPGGGNRSNYLPPTIAIQPSCGRPDALHQARARGEHATLDTWGMAEWALQISVG